MKKNISSLLLVFIGLVTYAQSDQDSLWGVWQDESLADSTRGWAMDSYITIGYLYSQPDSAFILAKKLSEFAIEHDLDELHAESLRTCAISFSVKGDNENALKYFHQALDAFTEIGDKKGIARCMTSIGHVNSDISDYNVALEYYSKALEIYREIEYKRGISILYESIGLVYSDMEDYPKAIEYILKSLTFYKGENSPRNVAGTYINAGSTYRRMKEFEKALEYTREGLKICEVHSFLDFKLNAFINMGTIYMDQGNYAKALEYYQKTHELSREMGIIRAEARALVNIGIVYEKQGNYFESAEWCKRGLALAEQTGEVRGVGIASECLYKSYKGLQDYRLALKYYEKMQALDDSLNVEETNKKLMQMEFDKKHLSDSLLMVEDKLNTELEYQTSLSNERNTRNIIVLVGLGILLAAIASYLRMRYVRRTNKELAEKNTLIAQEKERAEESEKAKERFFNNISHEFRTPLTLIMGPLEEVLDGDINENSRPNLKIMQRSVSRLQGMINELLDLSKLEYGKIKLKASEQNIVHLTKQYLQSFESLADQKKIKLDFKSRAEEYNVWVDAEQIRKVLANLLSNAFKFTDEGGRIEVGITPMTPVKVRGTPPFLKGAGGIHTGILIKVTDTGIGIPTDQLHHIFDRFYQVVDDKQTHAGGSGIGLALTKELVELHHGTIAAESHPGKGTTFTVFIPFGKEQYAEDELVTVESSAATTLEVEDDWAIKEEISGHVTEDEITKKTEKPIVLIVEDNPDMMEYISSHLEKKYKLLKAKDGEQGLAMAIDQVPDLVISDVMMPKMDGIAMTEKLKTDQRTSHIPIIMLTARASVDSKIEGLETGADDYVTKPFNARELQTRVKNLIEQRTKLREHFAKELNAGITITKENQLPSMDQKFIQKAVEVVNEHLSENEYDVNQFSAEMALSRSQLHRKIKALTNKSATEFIRTIRLNKAAELLKKKTDNITQIAYETGFNNLSWFAKGFKEQFGVSPSEYMKADD